MNLCKDCIHCQPFPGVVGRYELAKCSRSVSIPNLVDGTVNYRFCANERDNENSCGREGKHFQPDNADVLP